MKKFLKVIGVIILSLGALFFISAALIPKNYTVSVSTTINKPLEEVRNYAFKIKSETEWSEWMKADPKMKMEFIGEDGTVGFIHKWTSLEKKVGIGEQEILEITDTSQTVALRFSTPFESKAKAAQILRKISDNETLLIHEFYSDNSYPTNLMSYFMGKPMIEETEIKNVANIKAILEK